MAARAAEVAKEVAKEADREVAPRAQHPHTPSLLNPALVGARFLALVRDQRTAIGILVAQQFRTKLAARVLREVLHHMPLASLGSPSSPVSGSMEVSTLTRMDLDTTISTMVRTAPRM